MTPEVQTKYFAEIAILLKQTGYTPHPVANGLMPVTWHDKPLCQVNANGGIQYEFSATAEITSS